MSQRRFNFDYILLLVRSLALMLGAAPAWASYVNFEASQVHPLALTPSRSRLLALNTPDAILEIFSVKADGSLAAEAAVPVGLEPVSVVARTDAEAWVVNFLSDSVDIVDLDRRTVIRTLRVGDEPTDLVFTQGKAFVSLSGENAVKVYDLADLAAPPVLVPLFGSRPRALAVSRDQASVYAVLLDSGNQTTTIQAEIITANFSEMDPARLAALGVADTVCSAPPPPYPPMPVGILRDPTLPDPPGGGVPPVGLIVRWDGASGRWLDDAGQDWSACLPFRLPDHDLFVIKAQDLSVTTVDHLGTSLFEVSVNPANGKIYVPHTEARNFIRFEHPLGVAGHVVDNRLAIVDPAAGNATTILDLNTHINRASDPKTNLAERLASVSQPGMMVWTQDGTRAYLTAIGSRKVFALDGNCLAGACIFGANRATPAAVDVGEGPTGVALNEAKSRLYVLNRLANSIAMVDTATLGKIGQIALHDPSDAALLAGRHFLYDAVLSSGHGDAACSTCHISGDSDFLAWDLGNPGGSFVPYSKLFDNVRFVPPIIGVPSHTGFDPQKGPMMTQTFRGMLEPLHWRGDKPTMADFNPAFVGLLGAADAGPVNGNPAGLSAADMESFRQFALAIRYPPNPWRNVDDVLPDADVTIPGTTKTGNPTRGETIFRTFPVDATQPCLICHTDPFGAGGGKLGGVTPQEPTSPDAAGLFTGDKVRSPHSDVKVAHLREVYRKIGPAFGQPGTTPDARRGFGILHDGSLPDLFSFLSWTIFNLSPANGAEEVRDVASFVMRYPTGTRPCVGQQVTVPPGAPPTGSAADESLLASILTIADAAAPNRHGEAVASGEVAGALRTYRLDLLQWTPDVAGGTRVSTAQLRTTATGPITFMCVPVSQGQRLGGDRDEDGVLNADDCDDADPLTWTGPAVVPRLLVVKQAGATRLIWDAQTAPGLGPSLNYELAGGLVDDLRQQGLAATSCVKGDLVAPSHDDLRAGPGPGSAYFYQARARNSCGGGDFGPGLGAINGLDCRGF